jgi:hypothetical protein
MRGAAPPPVQADAYGVNVEALSTCLSCTSARAERGSSGGEGRTRVAGESVSEGQVPANGYANGTLVAAPFNDLLHCSVAGWNGSTAADRNSSRGDARSALLDLSVGDGSFATVTLLDSASEAGYDESSSRARSRSDAARAALGGGWLGVVVLHTDGSTDGPGHTSVLSVDGVGRVRPLEPEGGRVTMIAGVTTVSLLHSDTSGGLVASASDGRDQRVLAVGTTWAGSPSADPQPLR